MSSPFSVLFQPLLRCSCQFFSSLRSSSQSASSFVPALCHSPLSPLLHKTCLPTTSISFHHLLGHFAFSLLTVQFTSLFAFAVFLFSSFSFSVHRLSSTFPPINSVISSSHRPLSQTESISRSHPNPVSRSIPLPDSGLLSLIPHPSLSFFPTISPLTSLTTYAFSLSLPSEYFLLFVHPFGVRRFSLSILFDLLSSFFSLSPLPLYCSLLCFVFCIVQPDSFLFWDFFSFCFLSSLISTCSFALSLFTLYSPPISSKQVFFRSLTTFLIRLF